LIFTDILVSRTVLSTVAEKP